MAEVEREKFHKFYLEKLSPMLGTFETERLEVARKCRPFDILIVIFIVLLVILFISTRISQNDTLYIFIILSIILLVSMIFYVTSLRTKLRYSLKQNVVSKILALYGNIYFAGKKDVIQASEIRQMGLFPRFTSKVDDDIVIGVHKNCNFVICETCMQHTEGSGKNKRTVTDFKGLIIKVQMNKNFSGQTVVGFKGEINKPNRNFEQVELESVNFMKGRYVYSTDQIEARYILTTAFMERIKALGEVFHKNRSGQDVSKPISTGISFIDKAVSSILEADVGVSAAFIDGYAYLFIPTYEDFFEIPIDKSLYNEELYYNICTELDSILGIIEYLHLDQRTGL